MITPTCGHPSRRAYVESLCRDMELGQHIDVPLADLGPKDLRYAAGRVRLIVCRVFGPGSQYRVEEQRGLAVVRIVCGHHSDSPAAFMQPAKAGDTLLIPYSLLPEKLKVRTNMIHRIAKRMGLRASVEQMNHGVRVNFYAPKENR